MDDQINEKNRRWLIGLGIGATVLMLGTCTLAGVGSVIAARTGLFRGAATTAEEELLDREGTTAQPSLTISPEPSSTPTGETHTPESSSSPIPTTTRTRTQPPPPPTSTHTPPSTATNTVTVTPSPHFTCTLFEHYAGSRVGDTLRFSYKVTNDGVGPGPTTVQFAIEFGQGTAYKTINNISNLDPGVSFSGTVFWDPTQSGTYTFYLLPSSSAGKDSPETCSLQVTVFPNLTLPTRSP